MRLPVRDLLCRVLSNLCLLGQWHESPDCVPYLLSCTQDLKDTLIYTRISGYGQTGPKAHLAGYASVCEAYGGIRHLNGYLDRPPVRPNISLGDSLTGLHAAFGAVMALLHRQRHHLKTPGQVRHVAGPFPPFGSAIQILLSHSKMQQVSAD